MYATYGPLVLGCSARLMKFTSTSEKPPAAPTLDQLLLLLLLLPLLLPLLLLLLLLEFQHSNACHQLVLTAMTGNKVSAKYQG